METSEEFGLSVTKINNANDKQANAATNNVNNNTNGNNNNNNNNSIIQRRKVKYFFLLPNVTKQILLNF